MTNNLQFESEKLGIWYFKTAVIFFAVQLIFGLIAAVQYVYPSFLFEILDFSINRIIHINALIVWVLYAMIGSVYFILPNETKIETIGIKPAKIMFIFLTICLSIVFAVYLFVQIGSANQSTLWFITQGREYLEAPLWADIAIIIAISTFVANVCLSAQKGQRTGIITVLIADLVALVALYFFGMFYIDNISQELYLGWWIIHLWIESTWQVLIACLAGYTLIKTIGASRKIVEMWLWINITIVFGVGILGVGHHFFWIGTPEYWKEIGAVFSTLQPVGFIGMFIHILYDLKRKFNISNAPAFNWLLLSVFGNFFGAWLLGFLSSFPQINIYTHGTQLTSAHAHLAFYGAYATILIAMFYMGIQKIHNIQVLQTTFSSKMGIILSTLGLIGISVTLTISSYNQVLTQKEQTSSIVDSYFFIQESTWMMNNYVYQLIFGIVTLFGFLFLIKDLLTTSKNPMHIKGEIK